jgi:hypothetical protein
LAVADATWKINWHEKSYDTRKALVFIMMRAQQPIGLSASKFFFINLQTFTKVKFFSYRFSENFGILKISLAFQLVSSSISYFTILQNLVK